MRLGEELLGDGVVVRAELGLPHPRVRRAAACWIEGHALRPRGEFGVGRGDVDGQRALPLASNALPDTAKVVGVVGQRYELNFIRECQR